VQYVSEAVAAVAEAPLKLRDISAAVAICSAMHQRYAEFSKELIPALARTVAGSATSPEERPSAGRRRVTLRLLIELLFGGLYTTHTILLKLFTHIIDSMDFAKNQEGALLSLSLVTTFVKSGREELVGLPHIAPVSLPANIEERARTGGDTEVERSLLDALKEYDAELRDRWVLPNDVSQQFRAGAERQFAVACAAMQAAHEALTEVEKGNERVLNNRGDLPESLAVAYEAQRAAFESLQRSTASLAEVLERPLPELQADNVTRMTTTDIDGSSQGDVSMSLEGGGIVSAFEDEESRAFYEDLPSLREIVPAVLLGGETGTTESSTSGTKKNNGGGGAGGDGLKEGQCEEDGKSSTSNNNPPGDGGQLSPKGRRRESESAPSLSENATTPEDGHCAPLEQAIAKLAMEPSMAISSVDGETESSGSKRALDAVLDRLPNCVSKELCDEVATEFCYAGGAGKGARRRLARSLFEVPIGALQLLPYYSRIMAVLAPLFPDVPATVVAQLETEFADLIKKKDATLRTLEPRLRNARYIAEMLKFKIFPPGTAFSLLKSLLDDFVGHNVDAACALVEAAGRYLSRRPDTATRLNNMLDVM